MRSYLASAACAIPECHYMDLKQGSDGEGKREGEDGKGYRV